MFKRFWMVFREGGMAPRVTHGTFEDAEAEAIRLAKANPTAKFYVLQSIKKVEATVEVKSQYPDPDVAAILGKVNHYHTNPAPKDQCYKLQYVY